MTDKTRSSGDWNEDALKILSEVSSRSECIPDMPVPGSPSAGRPASDSENEDIDVESVSKSDSEFIKSLPVKKRGRNMKPDMEKPQSDDRPRLCIRIPKPLHGCKICGKQYKKLGYLKTHMSLHKNKNILKSAKLEKLPLRKINLDKQIKGRNECFNCQDCGKTFSKERYLTLHKRRYESERNVTVKINSTLRRSKRVRVKLRLTRKQVYSKSQDLFRYCAKNKRFSCLKCKRRYKDIKNMNKHLTSHEKKRRKRKTPQKISERGKKKVSVNAEKICPECGKVFKRTGNFRIHLRVHTGEKPFLCDYCGRAFSRLGNLKTHKLIHTGERPHTCPDCGKSFTTAGNLKSHRLHSVNKPCHATMSLPFSGADGETLYKCDKCGENFTMLSQLETHTTVAHGGQPTTVSYSCKMCDKKFEQLCSLRIHMVEHKPYKCSECGKGFLQRGSLRTHQRIHADDKPYICWYCHKGFAQKGNLDAHIFTHTGERPHSCPECGKSFATKYRLKAHFSVHARWDKFYPLMDFKDTRRPNINNTPLMLTYPQQPGSGEIVQASVLAIDNGEGIPEQVEPTDLSMKSLSQSKIL